MAKATGTTVKRGDSVFIKKQVVYRPTTQMFSQELNNAAWNFYVTIRNTFYLQKALIWAKRANEFYASPEVMDTYARLLYKAGSRSEAIEWMNKAILLRKAEGFGTDEFEAVLAKMKTNSLTIDSYQ